MTPLSGPGALFVIIAALLILALPRRWAALPLLLGTFYMTLSQGIELGPLNLFAIRLLLAAGIARVIVRREAIHGGVNGLDRAMIVWSIWAACSSIFHADPAATLKFNLGIVFNASGTYFLLRTFCTSLADTARLCAMTVLLLVPVAAEMYVEQLTAHNAFSVLGGVSEMPQIREGRLRAQGPFAHAILAGTVGAICLPLAVALWRSRPRPALIGITACLTMILTSASSGPVMSALFAVGALSLWPLRHRMRSIRWGILSIWASLSLAMSAPAYYLIARIDIAGGSTGWYRARLIESAIEHIDEWWLGGTDITRHWMATGIDSQHADITNHYIYMGVTGGLLLLALFIVILVIAFRYVGLAVQGDPSLTDSERFFIWALGASLFAHTATFISVSYFDQSFVFLYLTLAVISSIAPRRLARASPGNRARLTPANPVPKMQPRSQKYAVRRQVANGSHARQPAQPDTIR